VPNLHVNVHFNGCVVDDRVLRVKDATRLGSSAGAAVAFPGDDILVRSVDGCLVVRGRRLIEGRVVRFELGEVAVELQGVLERPTREHWTGLPDPRLLLAVGAMVLFSAWVDTVMAIAARIPSQSETAQPLIAATDSDSEDVAVSSAPTGSLSQPADGRYRGEAVAPDPHLEPAMEWPPAVYVTLE
jgi:hypothetical protein